MDEDTIKVVVEIPKGSRNKYERDPDTGEMTLDRRLYASVSYPTEYGFVEDTCSEDGDALDALVAITEPTFPGCVIHARPVAVLQLTKRDGRANPKVLVVPLGDPAWNRVEDVGDLPDELRHEIAHFFSVYSELDGSEPGSGVEVHGWGDAREARKVVEAAQRRAAGH